MVYYRYMWPVLYIMIRCYCSVVIWLIQDSGSRQVVGIKWHSLKLEGANQEDPGRLWTKKIQKWGRPWKTWFYMILYDFIWLYMSLYDFIWFYMILYDFIWFYMILYDFMTVFMGKIIIKYQISLLMTYYEIWGDGWRVKVMLLACLHWHQADQIRRCYKSWYKTSTFPANPYDMVCQKAMLRKHPALAGKDVPLQDIQTLENTRCVNAQSAATSRTDVFKATSHQNHHHHPPPHHRHRCYPPSHSLIDIEWYRYTFIQNLCCVYISIYKI